LNPLVSLDIEDLDVPAVVVVQNDDTMTAWTLPTYGEVRIVTHGGRVKLVETVTKEKME